MFAKTNRSGEESGQKSGLDDENDMDGRKSNPRTLSKKVVKDNDAERSEPDPKVQKSKTFSNPIEDSKVNLTDCFSYFSIESKPSNFWTIKDIFRM